MVVRRKPRHFSLARPETSDRRLTYDQAETIRARWQAETARRERHLTGMATPADGDLWPFPVTLQRLAAEYGVTRTIIWGIVSGHTYRQPDRPAHTLHHPNHAGGASA